MSSIAHHVARFTEIRTASLLAISFECSFPQLKSSKYGFPCDCSKMIGVAPTPQVRMAANQTETQAGTGLVTSEERATEGVHFSMENGHRENTTGSAVFKTKIGSAS